MRENQSFMVPQGLVTQKMLSVSNPQSVILHRLEDHVTKILIDHINQYIKNNIESVDGSFRRSHQQNMGDRF